MYRTIADTILTTLNALSSIRWKRLQDAVIQLSGHGIVLIVEESHCLQAKVYLKWELFLSYDYRGEGRLRFGISLGIFVNCLNTFSVPEHASVIEIRYPGPNMQLLLKYEYKFIKAKTSNILGSVIKDNGGSKLTMGRGGMLKVQHLVSVSRSVRHPHIDSAGYQQPSRIAYIEFFVKPEEDQTPINDS